MLNIQFNAETHKYTVDGRECPESVTQILRAEGIINLDHIPTDRLEAAQQFGTHVHKACELYDRNDLNEDLLDEHLRLWLESWKKTREHYGIKVILNEEAVYSSKWQYPGKIDVAFTWKKPGIILADLKTPKEVSPATRIQLAAYEVPLLEMGLVKSVKERWAIHLQGDGGLAKIEVYTGQQDIYTWLAILQTHQFKLKHNLIKKEKTHDSISG